MERGFSVGRIVLIVVIVTAVVVAIQAIDPECHLGAVRAWLRSFGGWAPVVFVLGYAVATTCGVPGTPLTIVAAILFGPWLGVVTMIVASTLAAVVGFLLSRFVVREHVEQLLSRSRTYEKLQRMVSIAPFTAISFARVMPAFPFTVVNYALGCSRVSFGRYLLATEIAMVPLNLLWVLSAGTVWEMLVRGEPPWSILLTLGGVALCLLGAMLVGARRLEPEPEQATP